jgi:hypothetical protein
MRTIQQVRKWLIIVAAVFAVLDIAAAAFLWSPAGRSRAVRQEAFSKLRTELLEKKRDNAPARDMDTKLKAAREQVDDFYKERLPNYYSQISETLGKEAAANRVTLAAVRYETGTEGTPQKATETGLQPLFIGLDVDGAYGDQMRFLNSLERSKLLFIPVQISFGGQQQGAGANALRVTLRLQTYLRKAS